MNNNDVNFGDIEAYGNINNYEYDVLNNPMY